MRPLAYCKGCKRKFKVTRDYHICMNCKLKGKKLLTTEFNHIVCVWDMRVLNDYLEKWYGFEVML